MSLYAFPHFSFPPHVQHWCETWSCCTLFTKVTTLVVELKQRTPPDVGCNVAITKVMWRDAGKNLYSRKNGSCLWAFELDMSNIRQPALVIHCKPFLSFFLFYKINLLYANLNFCVNWIFLSFKLTTDNGSLVIFSCGLWRGSQRDSFFLEAQKVKN